MDQSGIQWVSGLHRSAHIQHRSLGQNLGVGTVDEGFWHKLVKGLLDMTAHSHCSTTEPFAQSRGPGCICWAPACEP
jgi:hypothetical protein